MTREEETEMTGLPRITLDAILALCPCYERETIDRLAAGRTEGNALDVLRTIDLNWYDCLWLLCRTKLIQTRVWKEWALDCVERVLPIFEQRRPYDKRPRRVIEAARAYLRGDVSREQLDAARREAAAAAAPGGVAGIGAHAADAGYADDIAAGDAARSQEQIWQREHLIELVIDLCAQAQRRDTGGETMTRADVMAMAEDLIHGKTCEYRGHRIHFYMPPIPIRLDWHYDCERFERSYSELTLAGLLDEIDEHVEEKECKG